MSWNPLRRIPPTQRPELDPTTQSANETLDKLVADFDSAENVTKALCQAVKKLPDHILCMGKFETKLTDDITSSNIFSQDEAMLKTLEEWHSLAFIINTIGDEYVIGIQKNVIEPLKQLKSTFAELRASIRLNDSIQLDVGKYQRKVASYNDREKTAANLVKLQETKQALAASHKEFSRRTQDLVNELTKFLAGSVELLKPLLEGFMAAEVAWIRACAKSIDSRSHLVSAIEQSTNERMKNIEDIFKSLSTLSICSDYQAK